MIRYLRRLVLAVEAWTWAHWNMISAPPEWEGATGSWSPAADFAAVEPADWDDAARSRADAVRNRAVEDTFRTGLTADLDHIEDELRVGLHAVEVLARAFLTGGHTEDNLPIIVALASA